MNVALCFLVANASFVQNLASKRLSTNSLFSHVIIASAENVQETFRATYRDFLCFKLPDQTGSPDRKSVISLRKAGIPSNALSIPDFSTNSGNSKDGTNNAALPFANPFKDMQVPNALKSWQTPPPPAVEVASSPLLEAKAPECGLVRLQAGDGRPTIVVFLRHTGCPFAEKTFLELRRVANKYPAIHCVAISHASKAATDKWVAAIGGAWAVRVVLDEGREVYACWGLGVSTTYHLLNPWTQMAARRLGTNENIWGREVDPSANRWQVGGCWAIDEMGFLKWGAANKTADSIPDLAEACKVLGFK